MALQACIGFAVLLITRCLGLYHNQLLQAPINAVDAGNDVSEMVVPCNNSSSYYHRDTDDEYYLVLPKQETVSTGGPRSPNAEIVCGRPM